MILPYKEIRIRPARQFGLILLFLLLLIQVIQAVRGTFFNLPLICLTAAILIALVLPPGVMKSIFWIIMIITGLIGTLITFILLGLLFFLLVFTLGLFRRLAGKSPVDVRLDGNKESYWIEIDDYHTDMTKQY